MNATYKHFFPNLHWCNIMRNNLEMGVIEAKKGQRSAEFI